MKNKISKERERIEQEKNMLKLTLDILVNENNQLKNSLNEINNSVKENKIELQERLNTITNKDEVLNNLNNQIKQLKLKFYELKSKSKRYFSDYGNSNTMLKFNEQTSTCYTARNINKITLSKNLEKNKEIKNKNQNKINHYQDFYYKQNELDNEINDIKRQINFLINKFQEDEDIILMKEKFCNLKNIFDDESLEKLKKILNEKNSNNILYLVDKNKKVWKLKKREDIPKNDFEKEENIICSNFNNLTNNKRNYNLGEFSNRQKEIINEYFLLTPEDIKKKEEKNTAVDDMMKSSFIL